MKQSNHDIDNHLNLFKPWKWLHSNTSSLAEITSQSALSGALLSAKQHHVIDHDAYQMLQGVIAVSNKKARDVMIPYSQMITLKKEDSFSLCHDKVTQSKHSRFPVIGEHRDDILGILLAKDLLDFPPNKTAQLPAQLIRPATFIPESKRLNILLKEFRISHNHMAVVVDEYSNIAGLVTIEDVLEQIVGEIEDEYDTDEALLIHPQKDHTSIVDASCSIEQFNQHFNCQLPNHQFDTLGGLLLHQLARIPKRGDSTTYEQFSFSIIRSNHRRIKLIKVTEALE